MGIIKSVLIKAFFFLNIKKKNTFFLHKICILQIRFVFNLFDSSINLQFLIANFDHPMTHNALIRFYNSRHLCVQIP